MNASPSPPPQTACQRAPERWFDRHQRGAALAGCLACPLRTWCAREALSCNASWGMWAGVWIDGSHDDAAPYLRAIAKGPAAQHEFTATVPDTNTAAPPPVAALRRPVGASPARSVAAALLTRSSGHCEVLAEGCRYTFDRAVDRRCTGALTESACAVELFAACTHCAETVSRLAPRLAIRLGYRVELGCDPAAAPFHWRGSRWVLLGRDGWLTELGAEAQSA